MKTPEPKEFKRVREAAEAALEKFAFSGFNDAYNPADLRVVDVGWCLHETDEDDYDVDPVQWMITIEEASPDAYKLQGFVAMALGKQGITARIITEW